MGEIEGYIERGEERYRQSGGNRERKGKREGDKDQARYRERVKGRREKDRGSELKKELHNHKRETTTKTWF